MLAVTVIGLPDPRRVAGQTWTGGAASNDWTYGANWQGGTAPTDNGTAAVIFPTSNFPRPYVNGARLIGGLSFLNTSTSYIIGGDPLLLGSSGLSMSGDAVSQRFNCSVALAGNQSWDLGNAGAEDAYDPGTQNDLTFSQGLATIGYTLTVETRSNSTLHGKLYGAGALVVTANPSLDYGHAFPRLTLDGANPGDGSYTGAITINGALLRLTNSYLLGFTSQISFVNNFAGLDLSSSDTLNKRMSIDAGTTAILSVASGETLTLSGLLNLGNAATFAVGSYNAGTIAANFTLQGEFGLQTTSWLWAAGHFGFE